MYVLGERVPTWEVHNYIALGRDVSKPFIQLYYLHLRNRALVVKRLIDVLCFQLLNRVNSSEYG